MTTKPTTQKGSNVLFTHQEKTNANDPEMINPKGTRIRVPEARVRELISKGYILIDTNWKPTPVKETVIERKEPLPMNELQKEVLALQTLATVEI